MTLQAKIHTRMACVTVIVIALAGTAALVSRPRPSSAMALLGGTRAPYVTPTEWPPTATPTPDCTPGPGQSKCWSGVHMGNRNAYQGDDDWTQELRLRIDPSLGGQWPTTIVVLSNQVYNIPRPGENCWIQGPPTIRSPMIFDYIRRAALAGVKVVIRIWPSPGNFPDDPMDHELQIHPIPEYGYCDWNGHDGQPGHRPAADILEEMAVIRQYNLDHGFSEFGFEPANEPNIEWYKLDNPGSGQEPDRAQSDAWIHMNWYFTILVNWAATHEVEGINVLSPPMAPSAHAETHDVKDLFDGSPCGPMKLRDDPNHSGYYYMDMSFRESYGINWHSYWDYGREGYEDCPNGNHVSRYFPPEMVSVIYQYNKPLTITEADLFSWKHLPERALPDKDDGINASLAAASIREFFRAELEHWTTGSPSVSYMAIASWLNSDNTECWATPTPEQERDRCDHDWHYAYNHPDKSERQWFRLWYLGIE